VIRPTLEPLSRETVHRALDEAYDLLMDPGVRIHYHEALQLLGDSGAEVGMETRLARIPRTLAEKAVETAPSSFSLYDYERKPVVHYGGDDVHFDPGSAAIEIAAYEPLPLQTGVLRELEGVASWHAKAAGLDHLPELSTRRFCRRAPGGGRIAVGTRVAHDRLCRTPALYVTGCFHGALTLGLIQGVAQRKRRAMARAYGGREGAP
jgi:hypothetical protein